MAATIKDVARAAGVSASTVSRVLNNKGTISEETTQRIKKAMEELKYVPNDFARSFANGSPRAIALVIDVADARSYANSFFNNTVYGIETAAHRNDYSLVVTNGSPSCGGISSAERLALGRKVDGVILPISLFDRAFLAKLDELSFPCVILGRTEERDADTSWVDINNTQAGVLATRHLVQRGYRRIAFVSHSGKETFNADRISGYCRELDASGLGVDQSLIIHAEPGIDNAVSLISALLRSAGRPDAVLCGSDIVALGALRAAKREGLSVPEDLGILSFDNTVVTDLAEPGISSMDVDTYELGEQAAEILINQIENPGSSIRQVLLSTRVVESPSTARSAGAGS